MNRIVERLLNLLAFLLTAGRPVTADEIRLKVAGYGQDSDEAFRRMFERDKDLLRQLGVPLELRPTDAWEVEHGYLVPRDRYELPDPGLTDEERTALWLAAQVVRLGGRPSGPEALFKLGGMATGGGGEPLAADLGASPERLGEVFAAVTERRVIDFEYHGRPRTLRPYGLVHRRGHWYVLGAERGKDDVRAFRLDRAAGLAVGDRPGAFPRPRGFSARSELPDVPWEAGSEELTVTVDFDAEIAWWARRQLSPRAEVEERGDGSLRARFPVAGVEAFVGWMLGFEERAEVVDPGQVRELLVARVRGDA